MDIIGSGCKEAELAVSVVIACMKVKSSKPSWKPAWWLCSTPILYQVFLESVVWGFGCFKVDFFPLYFHVYIEGSEFVCMYVQAKVYTN